MKKKGEYLNKLREKKENMKWVEKNQIFIEKYIQGKKKNKNIMKEEQKRWNENKWGK